MSKDVGRGARMWVSVKAIEDKTGKPIMVETPDGEVSYHESVNVWSMNGRLVGTLKWDATGFVSKEGRRVRVYLELAGGAEASCTPPRQ